MPIGGWREAKEGLECIIPACVFVRLGGHPHPAAVSAKIMIKKG